MGWGVRLDEASRAYSVRRETGSFNERPDGSVRVEATIYASRALACWNAPALSA